MGWYPTIIENTLQDALTEEFWQDLLECLNSHNKACDAQPDTVEHSDRIYMPDSFCELFYDDSVEIESLKEIAFGSDSMEHVGSWLYDKVVHSVFEKHKINGRWLLLHKDGKPYYAGIEFVDGIPYSINKDSVKVIATRGEKL